jgi:hypothetical protein
MCGFLSIPVVLIIFETRPDQQKSTEHKVVMYIVGGSSWKPAKLIFDKNPRKTYNLPEKDIPALINFNNLHARHDANSGRIWPAGCGAAQIWCGAAQKVVRWLAVRQAGVRIPVRHLREALYTERRAMRKQECTLGEWMYEWMYCIVRKNIENKQKEWLIPPNLKKIYGPLSLL